MGNDNPPVVCCPLENNRIGRLGKANIPDAYDVKVGQMQPQLGQEDGIKVFVGKKS